MAEILFNKTVALVNAGPAVATSINLPQDISPGWTVVAVPVDSGGANPTQIQVERVFFGDKPDVLVASTPLVTNALNKFDQSVVATRLRVTLTPGLTAPSGGVRLQLAGTRNK